MATANFGRPTLSRVYAFGHDCEDQIDFDMQLEDIKSQVAQIKGFSEVDKWIGYRREIHAFGSFNFEVYDRYYQTWEVLSLYVTIESGYYSGAMVDVEDSEFEGFTLGKVLEQKIARKKRVLERVLSNITTPLVRVATFSNGEAIYELASNPRAVIKSIVTGGI